MAHPARRGLVDQLVSDLGITADHVVWDRCGHEWGTGRRAWQAHDPAADWHLVIQDDALVCRDLLAGLAQALEGLPATSVASLYLGKDGPPSLAGRTDSWLRAPRLIWGPAIAVPVDTIGDMLAWCEQIPRPIYDARIGRYYERQRRWPTYYAWPSLVDHRPVPSLLDHPDGRRSRQFVGEQASALDWTPPPIRTQLAGRNAHV